MPSIWTFQAASQLVFGSGASDQISESVARRAIRRVLIVSDETLVSLGHVDRVQRALAAGNIESDVFDGGHPEPSVEVAQASIRMAKRTSLDAVLGLGGGSNMDVAKITAAVVTHGGSPADYFGFDRIPGPVVPVICVPTTAGTGSEVSHSAVLTDARAQIKVSTLSNFLRPALAIVDPQLTFSCPRQVTADSGIDALAHAIEACTAMDAEDMPGGEGRRSPYSGLHPLGECIAERAIQLVGEHLRTAVLDGGNIAAREGMALAATLAGMAFSNCGVALVHALEYPIGGTLHCSHGAGNGLLLPYVMNYNLPVRQAALAKVAMLLGENVNGLDEHAAADQAVAAVKKLQRDIGIPQRLRELGASAEQLPEFAEKAFDIKRLLRVNPRTATRQDLLDILESAL